MDEASSTKPAATLGFDPAVLVRVTAEQFEAMVNAGVFAWPDDRVELRNGLLCRMNAQYAPHGIAKADTYDALRDALRALGPPLRVLSEVSVRVSDHDMPQPDIFVWEAIATRGPVPVERVRLIVEICDTTQDDDFSRKPALYAAAGIPEYWIIDLPSKVVHQRWAPSDGAYTRGTTIPFGDTVASVTIPGLAIGTEALRDQDAAE